MTEIGLFPLALVLLPHERIPLHIFEERYRDLIGECLETGDEFGLVYADDDGIRELGTRAGVVEVLDRFDDGRMNVLVEGRERFRLLELTSGRTFQTGEVASVADDEERPDLAVAERALGLFTRLRELTGSDVEIPAATTAQLSYALASRVELDPEIKLDLLARVSERSRLERVCELLEAAAVTVERQRLAAERAMTNGRVHLDA
jgi:Lon protease-like protein